MVVVACSLVQRYFGAVDAAAGTIGEGIAEEGTVDGETDDGDCCIRWILLIHSYFSPRRWNIFNE